MRGSEPEVTGRGASTGVPARVGTLLAPPDGLLGRVRWVFLLLSLLMAAVVFGLILRSEVTPLALRLAALAAIVGLAWWWIRGYARGGFPSPGIAFEGTAIFAAALATGAPPTALGLIYSSLMFRSLFGPLGNVVALLLAYLAAFYGSAVLALSFTYLDLPFAAILPEPLGLPLVAITLHALAATIRRQERTVSREQTLREAGAELVRSLDREEIYGAVLAGAIRLARDVPGTRASLATGPPESMTVVAAAGEGAEAIKGRSFDLRDLPEEVRGPVLGKASAWIEDADPHTMREALGFEPKVGCVLYVPLLVDDEVNGLLVVASDGTLPEDIKDSLDTLGSQATLALENVARAEDLYRRKNEERLQALIQNASDLITVVDAEGKIIYESPSVKRLFGYEPEEIVGTGMTDMVHPEDAEKVWGIFAEIASKPGVSPRVEVRARHRDGSLRHIEAVANNFLHDPNLRGIVVNSRDVTERRRAEEASRESEAGLIAAQRIAHLGSWETGPLNGEGPDPRLEIRWSDELYRILGHEPGSFVPTLGALMEAIHPEDFERVGETMRRSTLASERQVEMEHRVLRPDGETRTVRARVETVYGPGGEPVSSHGIMLDVTESKKVEDALRRSESELAAAQRLAHVGNWVFEVDRDEARWSDEMYRIFGFEPGAFTVTYKTFFRFVHPDDREKVRRAVRRALFGGEPVQGLDYRIRRADGEVRHLRAQYEIVPGPAGTAARLIGTAHDVTERERSEEVLRQSEERYRAVVEQAGEGIFVFDPETKRILEANPAFHRMFGYGPEEVKGVTLYELVPQDTEGVDRNVARAVERGYLLVGERNYRRKDGSGVDVEVSGGVISYGGREVICSVVRDITERKRVEEALRESEEMFRAVFESAATGVALADSEGRFVRVNPALAGLLGYEAEELRGMTVMELTHPEDLEPNVGSLRRLLDGQVERYRLEKRYVRKDGSLVWAHVTVSSIKDADGEILWGLGLVDDITERKLAEEEIRKANEDLERRVAERTSELKATIADLKRAQGALRIEEARTRAIVETAPDAIITMADDGLIRSFNSGAERIFGYAAGQLLGRPLTILMPERYRAMHERGLRHLLTTGERTIVGRGPVELAGLHKDGTEFPLELTLGELREGGTVLFTGIIRDITERKEAEEMVRRAEERYRTLVERMPAVTYIQEIGSPDSATYMSPQIEDLTGYTPEHCQDPDFRWGLVHPADRERLRQSEDEQTGEPGEVFTDEYRVVHRGGHTVWVRNESVLIEDEDSGTRYWHGFMVDITERKRAEAGLRAYAAKLQRSNRELQDFAHVASHDLQEPLRKVSSFSERLRTKYGDALGGQGLDYLRRMEGATVRMQKLIDDLLSLSRVTTRANPFEPVDLNGVAGEVLSDLEARLEETGGTVEVRDLPTIEADRAQMRQLLQNLIGNALKFHKEDEPPVVKVYADPEERAAGNGGRPRSRVVVEDNGIGFDEEHLTRIFVPFERLHGRRAYEGTGMGLAICRKVVERHGGEITARSSPGQGARFTITLPLKQMEVVPAGEDES